MRIDTRRAMRSVAAGAIAALCCCVNAQFSFTGASSASWNDEDNWQPQEIPGIGPNIGVSVTIPEDTGPAVVDVPTEFFLASLDAHGLIMTAGGIDLEQSSTIRGLAMDGGLLIAFPSAVVTLEDLGGPTTMTGDASLDGQGQFRNTGTLEARIDANFFADLVNEGTMRMLSEGSGFLTIGGELTNSDTLNLEGAWLNGGGELVNQGTVRVSGKSQLDVDHFTHQSGLLVLDPDSCFPIFARTVWAGGASSIGSGAELRAQEVLRVDGETMISGTGRFVQFDGASEPAPINAPLILDVAGGERSFLDGQYALNADLINRGELEALVTLTGMGALRNEFGADLLVSFVSMREQTTLHNLGQLTVPADLPLRIRDGAVLHNAQSGDVVLNASSNLGGNTLTEGTIRNEGTILKVGNGAFDATLDSSLEQDGGTLRVVDGTLNIRAGGELISATVEVEAPGELLLEGHGQSVMEIVGSTSFSGSGSVVFGSTFTFDTLRVLPGGTLTLSLSGAGFRYFGRTDQDTMSGGGNIINTGNFFWDGGRLGEPGDDMLVRNQGTMFVGSTGLLNATLLNLSAVSQTGSFDLAGEIDNRSGWKLDQQVAINDQGGAFVNSGTLTHDNAGASIVRALFDNQGTVHAANGVLTFTKIEQVVDGVLTGGIWSTDAGARIDLPRPLGTLGGDATVIGGSDRLRFLTDLRTMRGQSLAQIVERLQIADRLDLEDGAKMQIFPGGRVEVSVGIDNGNGASGDPSENTQIEQSGVGGNRGASEPPIIVTPVLENYARLVPGGEDAAGPFNLEGDLVMHQTGHLLIEIADGAHDALTITGGGATLGGILELSFLAGADPAPDESFIILTADTVNGSFDRIDGPETVVVSYAPGQVAISFDGCAADLTADGVLNFFDLSVYLQLFDAADPAADFTGDGQINFFDVSAFLSAFNAGCP